MRKITNGTAQHWLRLKTFVAAADDHGPNDDNEYRSKEWQPEVIYATGNLKDNTNSHTGHTFITPPRCTEEYDISYSGKTVTYQAQNLAILNSPELTSQNFWPSGRSKSGRFSPETMRTAASISVSFSIRTNTAITCALLAGTGTPVTKHISMRSYNDLPTMASPW